MKICRRQFLAAASAALTTPQGALLTTREGEAMIDMINSFIGFGFRAHRFGYQALAVRPSLHYVHNYNDYVHNVKPQND